MKWGKNEPRCGDETGLVSCFLEVGSCARVLNSKTAAKPEKTKEIIKQVMMTKCYIVLMYSRNNNSVMSKV